MTALKPAERTRARGGELGESGEEVSRELARAAGVHIGDYFKNVLLRISWPGTDVMNLTPHGWKERFKPQVTARRHDILKKLVGAA